MQEKPKARYLHRAYPSAAGPKDPLYMEAMFMQIGDSLAYLIGTAAPGIPGVTVGWIGDDEDAVYPQADVELCDGALKITIRAVLYQPLAAVRPRVELFVQHLFATTFGLRAQVAVHEIPALDPPESEQPAGNRHSPSLNFLATEEATRLDIDWPSDPLPTEAFERTHAIRELDQRLWSQMITFAVLATPGVTRLRRRGTMVPPEINVHCSDDAWDIEVGVALTAPLASTAPRIEEAVQHLLDEMAGVPANVRVYEVGPV